MGRPLQFNMQIIPLSPEQFDQLYNALADCYSADAGESSRNGYHFLLIDVLGRIGYRVNGTLEAETMAQEILDGQPVMPA